MQLATIALDHLSISPANMRLSNRPPDISDILPSVKARGVLVPLLVRANGSPGHFEIVAGRRRYFAAKQAQEDMCAANPVADTAGESGTPSCGSAFEAGGIDFFALPCAILEDSDDAAALEASLIENIARLAPGEIEQFETFVALTKKGRSVAQIALTFGITERQVQQRLALGILHPRIRKLYAREELDSHSLQLLTLATKAQQAAWLKLLESDADYAPTGQSLKKWLFGGAPIPVRNALFKLDRYQGQIISDLFGEEEYFADSDLFWSLQDTEIDARAASLREAGWQSVQLLERGERFQTWSHVRVPKAKGGRAYLSIGHDGTVEEHLGYLTEKELRKQARVAAKQNGKDDGTVIDTGGSNVSSVTGSADGPSLTAAMANYAALHRHAIVRLELAAHHGLALRMAIVWLLTGTQLWPVKAEPQRAHSDTIAASIANSRAQSFFNTQRQEIATLLGIDLEPGQPLTGSVERDNAKALFARLAPLETAELLRLLALLAAEGLAVNDPMIADIGVAHNVDAGQLWRADEAFFELLRDKASINALLAEVAGAEVASGNAKEPAKVQKAVLRDCLEGRNGRTAPERWAPAFLRFGAGQPA